MVHLSELKTCLLDKLKVLMCQKLVITPENKAHNKTKGGSSETTVSH
jgi:hypothetical protein